jgi:phosphomannomutase
MAKSTNKTFTKEEMIQAWTESPFSAEIRKTANDVLAQFKKGESNSEIEAFTIPLEFGTGGIRGVIGSGIGRMNEYTVGRAALGFCRFLKAKYKNKKTTLVIAYDSRRRSREFAEVTAGVAAKHKINVQLFPVVTPTPMLSYAVRHLKAQAGVVVTASHNPPEYNGFKAYLADGGQLVAPDDAKIIASIDNVSDWNEIPLRKKD